MIPNKLKIGGRTVDVKIVESTHPKLDNDRANGCYSTTQNTIYLADNCHKKLLPVVLLHEIIHTININIDEQTVEFLAQALHQVLKDNNLLKEL
jgi:hypothetical protein